MTHADSLSLTDMRTYAAVSDQRVTQLFRTALGVPRPAGPVRTPSTAEERIRLGPDGPTTGRHPHPHRGAAHAHSQQAHPAAPARIEPAREEHRVLAEASAAADSGYVRERKEFSTRVLVMAAGSVDTSKLLVRAGATGRPRPARRAQQRVGEDERRTRLRVDEPAGGLPRGTRRPVVHGSTARDDPGTAHTVIQAPLPPPGLDTRTSMLAGSGVSAGRGRFPPSRRHRSRPAAPAAPITARPLPATPR